jgi:hypothetical protein
MKISIDIITPNLMDDKFFVEYEMEDVVFAYLGSEFLFKVGLVEWRTFLVFMLELLPSCNDLG